jgi:coenzyme F420-reducing hydrogenase beta subunit
MRMAKTALRAHTRTWKRRISEKFREAQEVPDLLECVINSIHGMKSSSPGSRVYTTDSVNLVYTIGIACTDVVNRNTVSYNERPNHK